MQPSHAVLALAKLLVNVKVVASIERQDLLGDVNRQDFTVYEDDLGFVLET